MNILSRNLDLEVTVGEGSGGNEEHVTSNWTKGDACYLVTKSLVKWSPVFIWKAELLSNS